MKCAYHPDKDAVGLCVSCGAGLCADCRNVVKGAAYCEDCQKTHEPPRVFPGREGRGLNVWSVISLLLVLAGLWPRFEYLSVVGLVLGLVALGDIRSRGYTQTGRLYCLVAIGVAVVSLLVKYGLFFYSLKHGIEFSPWLNPFKYV